MNGRVITDVEDARTRRCCEALMQHYPEGEIVGGIATFVRDVLTVMDAAEPKGYDSEFDHPVFARLAAQKAQQPTLPPEAAEQNDFNNALDALEAMVRRDGS